MGVTVSISDEFRRSWRDVPEADKYLKNRKKFVDPPCYGEPPMMGITHSLSCTPRGACMGIFRYAIEPVSIDGSVVSGSPYSRDHKKSMLKKPLDTYV